VWQDGVVRPAGTPGGEKKKRVQKEKVKAAHADGAAPAAKKRPVEAIGAADAAVPKRLRGDGSATVVDVEGSLGHSGLKDGKGKRGKGAAKKPVKQRPTGVKALKGKRARGALGFKI
jgi:hypothetical protein